MLILWIIFSLTIISLLAVKIAWEKPGLEIKWLWYNNSKLELLSHNMPWDSEQIVWNFVYNDIIVSVEAPEWAFPSWTKLMITPITAENQVAEIKDSLIENTDVTEDSKAVSFDISFIYTMPDWELIELQPNEWYKVKVAFNYIKDEGFRQVDESEDREIKIYHLEWVKEESWDIIVQEVETNEKESSVWELVVDAEKFSIYSVAGVELRAAMCTVTFQNGHCYWVTSSQNTDDGVCTFDMPTSIQVECGQTISRQDIDEPYTCSFAGDEGTYNYYFAKWSTQIAPWGKNTSYNYDFSTPVTDDITLYAIWSYSHKNWWSQNYSVTVTFNANGWILTSPTHTSTGSMNYWYYGLVKQPSDPIRTWYALNCWTTSQNGSCTNAYNFDSTTNTITSNTTLYAQWTWGYIISFNANGWNGSISDITAALNKDYTLPDTGFSRDGYILWWWNTKSDGSGTWYSLWQIVRNLSTTNGTIVTLYAQWAQTNRVSFEGNWWTVSVPYIDVASGQMLQSPTNPTYSRHRFLWWYLTGSDTEFNFSTTPITWDITLYAHWEEVDLPVVTFNANWGTLVGESSQEVEPGERATKPQDPTKSNQLFKFWTTDEEWNNEYDFKTAVDEDLTLYAQWANICTVTFENGYCYRGTNNGSSYRAQCTFTMPSSIQVACWTPVRRPENPASPITVSMGTIFSNNYSVYFSRWSTEQQPWANNTSYNWNFDSPIPEGGKTLYAIWYTTTYTVTFNANEWILVGGSDQNVSWERIWSYWTARKPDDPIRTWYDFKWWSTSSSSNWSEFDFTTQITSDIILYALWTPITYTIKYNANGWVWNMANTDMIYDISGSITTNSFTKSNATFSGWNTQANGWWTWYTNWQSVKNLTDVAWRTINLYAQWNCNNGYHDENWECVSNTKQVSCSTGSTPSNAIPTIIDVTITWNNGGWSSPAPCTWSCISWYIESWDACEVANCTFQWRTIAHGSSLTVYSTSSTICPAACTVWTVTCSGWIVSGDTNYTNLSCNTISVPCDGSFTLSSTGANGIYDSCIPQVANGDTCADWSTLYRLDNCDSWYHTEDNEICTGNSKQVECTQSWAPLNGAYLLEYVTITWNGIWNSGSWSNPADCRWACKPHYHESWDACEIDTYIITWKDGDWNIIKTWEVAWNTTPAYTWPIPTKTATAQYTYTFNNTRSPLPWPATWDAVYTAQFDVILNQYTVTITSNNIEYGSVSTWSVTKDYDSIISINGDTIIIGWTTVTAIASTWTAQYTYTFSGWNNTCGNRLTWDCTIQAEFTRTVNQYSIQFVNDDEVLQRWMVAYWVMPEYTWATPEKESTAQYSYTFSGWNPEIIEVEWDAVYEAVFNTITNSYTVTINTNSRWTVNPISVTKEYNSEILINWNTITIWWTTVIATPLDDTAEFDYEFSWWNNTCGTRLTWDCIIIAEFARDLNSYTVTFNSNGWNYTPESQEVRYWLYADKPTDPTKTWYEFSGWYWSWTLFDFNTSIRWNISLVAHWEAIEYNITYVDSGDILTLQPSTYTIEDNITQLPEPERSWYTFSGWTESWVYITNISIWTYWDKILHANWMANTDTPYTVQYYLENLNNDKYTLIETETFRWTTDAQTNVVAKDYTWFTLVGNISQYQTTIKWDCSTVVELYYTRNVYEITFLNDWVLEILWSWMYKYGTPVEDIEVPENPTRPWTELYEYEFLGWTPEMTDVTTWAIYMAVYRVLSIPQIRFLTPTPENEAEWNQNRFTTKVEISNISSINRLIYMVNWDDIYNLMWLIYWYNFDDVAELWEVTNSLVKSIKDENDWQVHGATRVSSGRYWWAYYFDGIDDYIELSYWNWWRSPYVEFWAKPDWWEWTHLIIGAYWEIFINWKEVEELPEELTNVAGAQNNTYIWTDGNWKYFAWLIDEVKYYRMGIDRQQSYQSNLRRTSGDVREFETINPCLLASWTYDYSLTVNSNMGTSASTWRTLTTNIPGLSVSGTWYNFWEHEITWESYILSWTIWELVVTDMIWSGWWIVYLATSESLVWSATNEKISTENIGFKANSLEYSGMYEWYTNTLVSFGYGISTGEYNTAYSSECTNINCSGDQAKILEYITRKADPEDFMCWEVWTYSDSTQIMLEVPARQVEDEYNWTLWITLQEDSVWENSWGLRK